MDPSKRNLGVQSVNALKRGLDVLRAIQVASAASFTELQGDTGLPKATLARALKTLSENGWIYLDPESARYCINPAPLASSSSKVWRDRVAKAAFSAREHLQARVPWPNDLGIRDNASMLSIEGPHARNIMSANFKALGSHPSMLRSSLGRCYLSFCPMVEREEILEILRKSRDPADREGSNPADIQRMVEQVRQLGYATRNAKHTSPDSPEHFGALAVPVMQGGHAAAALCVVWIPSIMDERKIIDSYLGELKTAAHSIGLKLNEFKLRST